MSEFCPACRTDNYREEFYDGGEAKNYEGEYWRMACDYCGYGKDEPFLPRDEYFENDEYFEDKD